MRALPADKVDIFSLILIRSITTLPWAILKSKLQDPVVPVGYYLRTWGTLYESFRSSCFQYNRIYFSEVLHRSKSLLSCLSCGFRELVWARSGRCLRGQRSGGAAERLNCVRRVCRQGVFTGPDLAQRGEILIYPSAVTGNFQQHRVHPHTRCGRQMRRKRWTIMAMSCLGRLALQREVRSSVLK